jgi:dTDP-4-amino-4,6-dideoxygalactose transaminase
LNGKMSEFHAIVGLRNLVHIDELVAERQFRARCFREKVAKNTASGLPAGPRA